MSHSTEMERPDAVANVPAPVLHELDQLVRDEEIPPLRPPFLSKRAWALWALSLIGMTVLLVWLLLDGLYNNPPLQLTVAATSANPSSASTPDRLLLADQTAPTAATQQISDMIEAWRRAWQGRDADAYLRHYSQNFVPPNAQTGAQWRKARKQHLSSRSSIKVAIKKLRIERVGQNRFKVTFWQDYTAGKYQEHDQLKTLLIERVDDQWQIAGEWNGQRSIQPH